ncbi:hypothetical protein [Saccharomonospora saliphila]|uniref:hypothetical protein n=1 Tax=Saccharomonospora saliphila TaxID=369829 RepID=UPI00036E807B|nr:hypothetical protein [Saccharomonospora saliphila]
MTRLRTITALGLVLMLVTGCGGARAGRAVPDGEDVAEYVRDKFSATLERLDDDLTRSDPHQSRLRSFTRIDDRKADMTSTAIQFGDPPSRIHKNHSNRDSNDYRDYFHPGGSDVEYVLLGPVYAELAPTPWVSMPYDGAGLDVCYWSGYSTVCKMINAVARSLDNGHPDKKARSLRDGRVELTTKVSLRTFLDERIVIIPDWALEWIDEPMRNGFLDTRLVLSAEGRLQEIEMTGLISGEGHEIEVREHYQVLPAPTEHDVPAVPSADEVTELTTEEEVDEFYAGMQQITSSSD